MDKLSGQNISYVIYDKTNGFDRSYVNDIVRDSTGYYWLATEKGIVRFDGANFVEINPPTPKYKKAPVGKLYLHNQSLYLIYQSGGCVKLNLENYQFKTVTEDPLLEILELDDHSIIELHRDGLLTRQKDDKLIVQKKFQLLNPNGDLFEWNSRIFLGLNQKWINETLYCIDRDNLVVKDTIHTYPISFDPKVEIANGILFLTSENQIFKLDNKFNISKLPGFPGSRDYLINYYKYISSDLQYYIQNNKQLFRVKNGVHQQIFNDGTKNIQLVNICVQDSSNLLVGTNQGLIQIHDKDFPVHHLVEIMEPDSAPLKVRRKIINLGDNGILLFGIPYIYGNSNNGVIRRFSPKIFYSYDAIRVDDDLYFTTEGSGLIKMNLQTRRTKIIDEAPFTSPANYYSIAFNRSASLLVVGEVGALLTYNIKSGQTGTIKSPFTDGLIKVVAYDTVSRNYWVGCDKGLFCLDNDFKLRCIIDQGVPHGLQGRSVSDLHFDKVTHHLWVASENGVDVIDPENLRIVDRLPAAEFPNPKVVSLLQDIKGRIWMGTYEGIFGYDPVSKNGIKLGNKNKLVNSEFNYKAACVMQNGDLIFGGLNGYDVISANSFDFNSRQKDGIVTGYETISEKDTTFHLLKSSDNQKITFDIDHELIKIYLSVKDVPEATNYSFEYSFDRKSWTRINGYPFIQIYKLKPELYTLNLRANDEYGRLINFKPILINATVVYYKTESFLLAGRLLVLILLLLIIGIILFSRRHEQLLKENIAMDLHDEVGSILTRALYIAKGDLFKEKPSIIEGYLSDALYSLRVYINTMNKKYFTLTGLIYKIKDAINTTFAPLNYEINFNYKTDREYKLTSELYKDVLMCVYEIMTNVIKHSTAREVIITLTATDYLIAISVINNGIVTDISDIENRGNGIRNLKRRLKRNKGGIDFSRLENSEGIMVKISLQI